MRTRLYDVAPLQCFRAIRTWRRQRAVVYDHSLDALVGKAFGKQTVALELGVSWDHCNVHVLGQQQQRASAACREKDNLIKESGVGAMRAVEDVGGNSSRREVARVDALDEPRGAIELQQLHLFWHHKHAPLGRATLCCNAARKVGKLLTGDPQDVAPSTLRHVLDKSGGDPGLPLRRHQQPARFAVFLKFRNALQQGHLHFKKRGGRVLHERGDTAN